MNANAHRPATPPTPPTNASQPYRTKARARRLEAVRQAPTVLNEEQTKAHSKAVKSAFEGL